MRTVHRYLLAVAVSGLYLGSAAAQTNPCPTRPSPGTVVNNPLDLVSQNGVLTAAFTLKSYYPVGSFLQECYIYQENSTTAVEAPTLRLNPGDKLDLSFTNRLSYLPPPPLNLPAKAKDMSNMPGRGTPNDPCTGGTMVATSTNIHFHGLNIPPKCHEDEIVNTDIENTDPPFEYKFTIPSNDSPGMYWYHPHLHGVVTLQVNGGATGALIIGGMEKIKPQVAGLPERVFVIRQQFLNPNSWLPGPYQLTLNYEPADFPTFPSPILKMKPGAKEFWRVVNSTTQGFLNLQFRVGGTAQTVEIVALDGIPVQTKEEVTTVAIPPAGRAEFIITGPAAGQSASFWQAGFNTGPIGNPNIEQQLAVVQTSADAVEPPAMPAAPPPGTALPPQRFPALSTVAPTATRKLYFAEATNGSNGPTEFFITVDGQTPKVFNGNDPPNIVTKVGAVEDWTVENRTGETHAFHIHQIHFLFMDTNGEANPYQDLRDTVIVPAWSGTGPYSSVKLRMDFRDPDIAGTFVYHCHILDHEDAGMMAIIQVNPK